MKRNSLNKTGPSELANGLTFVEVLVSIVVVALLAILLIPAFTKARHRSGRVNCVSNLKQIGLAFRMWSNDHGEKFPWSVSTTNGGTLEFAAKPEVFRHYLAVSNELTSPKVLKCPVDKKRTSASSWGQLTDDARIPVIIEQRKLLREIDFVHEFGTEPLAVPSVVNSDLFLLSPLVSLNTSNFIDDCAAILAEPGYARFQRAR